MNDVVILVFRNFNNQHIFNNIGRNLALISKKLNSNRTSRNKIIITKNKYTNQYHWNHIQNNFEVWMIRTTVTHKLNGWVELSKHSILHYKIYDRSILCWLYVFCFFFSFPFYVVVALRRCSDCILCGCVFTNFHCPFTFVLFLTMFFFSFFSAFLYNHNQSKNWHTDIQNKWNISDCLQNECVDYFSGEIEIFYVCLIFIIHKHVSQSYRKRANMKRERKMRRRMRRE